MTKPSPTTQPRGTLIPALTVTPAPSTAQSTDAPFSMIQRGPK